MEPLNLLTVELDEITDVAGFRHTSTSLTDRLRTRWMGVSVYEVHEAGVPVFPYHFHNGVEEWLYVLWGAPELREPAGRRTLAPGDVVCFPDGRVGAHAVRGPGRFVMFSVGERQIHDCIYPDSNKAWIPDGLVVPRHVVGYWHAEGTGDADTEPPVPAPPIVLEGPPRPLVNVTELPGRPMPEGWTREGFRANLAQLGPLLGAEMIGATLLEIPPGDGGAPYHYEWGREEWLVVLDGTPTLRHPDGETLLAPGDLVFFPEGPQGAHRLLNRTTAGPIRAVHFSTKARPFSIHYVDSNKWAIQNPDGAGGLIFRDADRVDYWDGEP